jgi:hypothetical protein
MIEVDWQELFNSFFNTVRVKIQCKDSTRIPRERIFVFKSNVHLIVFTPEGYEQAEVSDGGSDKGGGEEKKGEDPLEDDLSASGKGGSNSPKEKSKEKEKDQSSICLKETKVFMLVINVLEDCCSLMMLNLITKLKLSSVPIS